MHTFASAVLRIVVVFCVISPAGILPASAGDIVFVSAGEQVPDLSLVSDDLLTEEQGASIGSLVTFDQSRASISGRVSYLDLFGSSTAQIGTTAEVSHLSANGQSHVSIAGEVSHVTLFESSTAVLSQSEDVGHLTLRDHSRAAMEGVVAHVNLYDSSQGLLTPSAHISHVTVQDDGRLTIWGGTYGFINLRDRTESELHAFTLDGGVFAAPGVVVFGGAVTYEPGAKATLHVRSFSFADGRAIGEWSNGSPLSFWLVEQSGDPGTSSQHFELPKTLPSEFTISMVPEASSFELIAVGAFVVAIAARAKSRRARRD